MPFLSLFHLLLIWTIFFMWSDFFQSSCPCPSEDLWPASKTNVVWGIVQGESACWHTKGPKVWVPALRRKVKFLCDTISNFLRRNLFIFQWLYCTWHMYASNVSLISPLSLSVPQSLTFPFAYKSPHPAAVYSPQTRPLSPPRFFRSVLCWTLSLNLHWVEQCSQSTLHWVEAQVSKNPTNSFILLNLFF